MKELGYVGLVWGSFNITPVSISEDNLTATNQNFINLSNLKYKF